MSGYNHLVYKKIDKTGGKISMGPMDSRRPLQLAVEVRSRIIKDCGDAPACSISLITGIFALLNHSSVSIAVLGDLIPAVTAMAMGIVLILGLQIS